MKVNEFSFSDYKQAKDKKQGIMEVGIEPLKLTALSKGYIANESLTLIFDKY